MKNLIIAFLLATGLTAGCSLGEGELNPGQTDDVQNDALLQRLTEKPVGFKLLVANTPVGGMAPAAASDEGGALVITAATVNLQHVEFKLPEGWACATLSDDDSDNGEDDASDDGVNDDDDAGLQASSDDTVDEVETEDDLEMDDDANDSGDDDADDDVQECGEDSDGDEIRFAGPYNVDLLTGDSTPPLTDLTVPPGLYKRIDLRIDDAETGPMVGYSLLAFGSYTTETTTPVVIRLKFNEDIRFESPSGVSVSEQGGSDIVLRISANDWFAGASAALDECLLEESALVDGILTIDDESDVGAECDEIEELLKDNFKQSGEIDSEDRDDDDDSEDDQDDNDDQSAAENDN